MASFPALQLAAGRVDRQRGDFEPVAFCPGYLRGLVQILDYLGHNGEIEPLLIGKLGPDHIGMVKELQWRKVLREAPLRPRYLEDPAALELLEELRRLGLDGKLSNVATLFRLDSADEFYTRGGTGDIQPSTV